MWEQADTDQRCSACSFFFVTINEYWEGLKEKYQNNEIMVDFLSALPVYSGKRRLIWDWEEGGEGDGIGSASKGFFGHE